MLQLECKGPLCGLASGQPESQDPRNLTAVEAQLGRFWLVPTKADQSGSVLLNGINLFLVSLSIRISLSMVQSLSFWLPWKTHLQNNGVAYPCAVFACKVHIDDLILYYVT